jgi:hypothetical protein
LIASAALNGPDICSCSSSSAAADATASLN